MRQAAVAISTAFEFPAQFGNSALMTATGLGIAIARRRAADGERQWLRDHLRSVGELSANYAAGLGDGLRDAARLAGLLHDLGKYRAAFQRYIGSATGLLSPDEDDYVDAAGLRGKVDHSTAGAQWVWRRLSAGPSVQVLAAQLVAVAITSHHSGLIDVVARDGRGLFARRMVKPEADAGGDEARESADTAVLDEASGLLSSGRLFGGVSELVKRIQATEQGSAAGGAREVAARLATFKLGMVQRLLLSVLVDADRTDSADFESHWARTTRSRETYRSWGVLCDRLEKALEGFRGRTGAVDETREQVSAWCRDAAARPPGMYTLTVPTGGGKTLASLRMALHHAARHGMSRIVYVVPYTSIIDQNADVARSVLEPGGLDRGRVVLEHHSNLVPEKRSGLNSLLAENWDAPVVYTTSVQLLEALFGGGTQSVRRLHRLSRAVVIFDEAQTLPVRCVHLFNNAMNFLVEHCGSTVVMCTATQPLLAEVDASKGALRLAAGAEIVPDVGALYERLQRVSVHNVTRPAGWTRQEVAALAAQQIDAAGSCLVIVNTKRDARAVHAALSAATSAPCFHLSTNLCPRHRREVLASLRAMLARGEAVCCVSTQLIEAGVDVDFGSVIRALAGLDAVAQGAGRCNRNGRRQTGDVWVVNLRDERIGPLPDIAIGREKARRVLDELAVEAGGSAVDPIGPAAIGRYFDYYFKRRGAEMAYPITTDEGQDTLLELLSTNRYACAEQAKSGAAADRLFLNQAFATAARHFKPIDTATSGVLVPYGDEGRDLLSQVRAERSPEALRRLIRDAQQYTVSVFDGALARLRDAGALETISDDLGIEVARDGFYDSTYGLVA